MAPQTIIIEEDGEDGQYRHHQSHGHEYHEEYRPRRHHHHQHRYRYRWRDYCCPCFPRFRMHSTQRFHCASVTTIFVLFGAFVLYLLAALSLPIIKAIYLFQLNFTAENQPATSIATNFRFGVWGFCASSVLDEPTVFTNNGECTPAQLGYTIPPDILALAGYPPQVTNAVLKALTILLVLHPTTAGLAFLTLLFGCFLRSPCTTIFALLSSIFTSVVGSVVLAADVAIVLVANNRLKDEFGNLLQVSFGPAMWMIVAATALSWLGAIIISAVACYCCGIRRKHGWYGDGYYA